MQLTCLPDSKQSSKPSPIARYLIVAILADVFGLPWWRFSSPEIILPEVT